MQSKETLTFAFMFLLKACVKRSVISWWMCGTLIPYGHCAFWNVLKLNTCFTILFNFGQLEWTSWLVRNIMFFITSISIEIAYEGCQIPSVQCIFIYFNLFYSLTIMLFDHNTLFLLIINNTILSWLCL